MSIEQASDPSTPDDVLLSIFFAWETPLWERIGAAANPSLPLDEIMALKQKSQSHLTSLERYLEEPLVLYALLANPGWDLQRLVDEEKVTSFWMWGLAVELSNAVGADIVLETPDRKALRCPLAKALEEVGIKEDLALSIYDFVSGDPFDEVKSAEEFFFGDQGSRSQRKRAVRKLLSNLSRTLTTARLARPQQADAMRAWCAYLIQFTQGRKARGSMPIQSVPPLQVERFLGLRP